MRVYGEIEARIDDKGRINVPQRFLLLFGEGGFLTRAFNGHSLVFFPMQSWLAFQDRMQASSARLSDQDAAQYFKAELAIDDLQRFLSCGAQVLVDGQNRLTVPPNLRRRAKLEGDITLLAVGDRLEIWDTDTWLAYDAERLTPAAIGHAMSELGAARPPLA
jgi:MraZ protein